MWKSYSPIRAVRNTLHNWTVPLIDGFGLLSQDDDTNEDEVVCSYSAETPFRYYAISQEY